MVTERTSPWLLENMQREATVKARLERLCVATGHGVQEFHDYHSGDDGVFEYHGFVLRVNWLRTIRYYNDGGSLEKYKSGYITVKRKDDLVLARTFAEALEKEGFEVVINKQWVVPEESGKSLSNDGKGEAKL